MIVTTTRFHREPVAEVGGIRYTRKQAEAAGIPWVPTHVEIWSMREVKGSIRGGHLVEVKRNPPKNFEQIQ